MNLILSSIKKERSDKESEEESEKETDADDCDGEDVATFVKSKKGKTILQFNGYRYREAYRTQLGIRWVCSVEKRCNAYVYLNDNDEIIMDNQKHEHSTNAVNRIMERIGEAKLITSLRGRYILLFDQYTYRMQYNKGKKARWVCSTKKECKGSIFTDCEDYTYVIKICPDHCHPPPKYYLKPEHVKEAPKEQL
ncbi:uncharacterized protein LOC128672687 [Plodia interpunctella]|uniref:uncharacterized protein LOC128672687 n=1 Tax=Plodia interpunctella TaxID=58824 RepID=UPI00236835D5|nr:uncharacterized protein LOC128672687 [Plodia interpunctella]